MAATPNSTEFHNAFARAFRACNDAGEAAAQVEDLRRRSAAESGPEWERRTELCRQAARVLFEGQAVLDGARTKLKDAWDQENPFPNPPV
jgi:hypothetical protein